VVFAGRLLTESPIAKLILAFKAGQTGLGERNDSKIATTL